jgi:hypothetical protein
MGSVGAKASNGLATRHAFWRVWPNLAGLVVALAIVVAFPWLSIGFF